ncbi:hypothetical protein AK812_SmicGene40637 [Symbiodinium microadriaticum]|uniref:Uncharacterized protein n=1 Tax=Symbiodinium microadriaticum TaxID=2951 RepID=A0A1Q9C837_SYMMI|nr:hypothetical protein AK812_SmicGene40637 [Symbiodinium microadriaticum]
MEAQVAVAQAEDEFVGASGRACAPSQILRDREEGGEDAVEYKPDFETFERLYGIWKNGYIADSYVTESSGEVGFRLFVKWKEQGLDVQEGLLPANAGSDELVSLVTPSSAASNSHMPTATVVEGSGETVTNDSQAVLQPTTSTYNDIEQSYWLWHDGAVSDGSVAAFHGEAFFSLYRWRMWRRAHLLGPVAFSLNTEKTSGHRRVPFDGRYYECGQPLARSTAAYLDESRLAEIFVTLVWSLATLFVSAAISVLPKPGGGVTVPSEGSSQLRRKLAWLLWIVPVTMISLPSILFSVAQALPKDNTLVADWILKIAHRTAPFLLEGIDMVLAVQLSIKYAGLSGIKADRLLMALRLCAAWLLPLLVAVALQENCLAGWKLWWPACDAESDMNAAFNWEAAPLDGIQAVAPLPIQILNTTRDMCRAHPESLWDGRCSRSVIEGLSPLILKKLLIRIAVQPFAMVLAWRASKLEDDRPLDDLGRHLRLLGWGPRTSKSLNSMQQHASFTTLLETAIVWGPLVPLVSFAVVAAFLSNAMLFEIGLSFGVRLPTDATNSFAGLSRAYLRFALAASCVFQLWHAFGTGMAGRTMLLLTSTLTAALSTLGLPSALRPASRPPRTGPEGLEMIEMASAKAEFPPLRIFLQSST